MGECQVRDSVSTGAEQLRRLRNCWRSIQDRHRPYISKFYRFIGRENGALGIFYSEPVGTEKPVAPYSTKRGIVLIANYIGAFYCQ